MIQDQFNENKLLRLYQIDTVAMLKGIRFDKGFGNILEFKWKWGNWKQGQELGTPLVRVYNFSQDNSDHLNNWSICFVI